VHLFVIGDGLAPETKSMKLYEVERHDAWTRRSRRLASLILPGSGHLLAGRTWVGGGLLVLWLLALLGSAPGAFSGIEGLMGLGVHLGELRPSAVPPVYGVDAIALLAVPLGLAAWCAANAGVSRLRRA
jgi:hypothetical protein